MVKTRKNKMRNEGRWCLVTSTEYKVLKLFVEGKELRRSGPRVTWV